MLTELFNRILEVAGSAAETEIVHLPGDDGYLVVSGNGSSSHHPAPIPPREYTASTILDFATLVARQEGTTMLVFVGNHTIEAILDEKTRRETVRFPLTLSRPFRTVQAADGARYAKSHREFMKLMRIDLTGCVPDDALSAFSALRFARSSEGESQIRTGDEAMSRKAKAAAFGNGNPIPDEIVLTVPVYEELIDEDWSQTVRCAVDCDLVDETLTLIPLAGEIQRAIRETNAWIVRSLQQTIGDRVDAIVSGTASS